jgi:GDP-D-mannose dehydratase
MTKRALITGITGMVGSHLLDYLLEHTDWEIHGMLRWRSPLDNISDHLDDINAGGRI